MKQILANAKCAVCDKKFHMKYHCNHNGYTEPWMAYCDTYEHWKIYCIVHQYDTGAIDEDQAAIMLENVDLSDMDGFRTNVKGEINEILTSQIKDIIYKFLSNAPSISLPTSVTSLLPEQTTGKKRDEVVAEPSTFSPVLDNDDLWTFDGWEPEKVVIGDEDVVFNGTWIHDYSSDPLTISGDEKISVENAKVGKKLVTLSANGNTVHNLWPSINNTINGVSVATSSTGLITVKGTATGDTYIGYNIGGIDEGSTLELYSSAKANVAIVVDAYNGSDYIGNVATIESTTRNNTSKTGTVPYGTTNLFCGVYVTGGDETNAAFRVVLRNVESYGVSTLSAEPVALFDSMLCPLGICSVESVDVCIQTDMVPEIEVADSAHITVSDGRVFGFDGVEADSTSPIELNAQGTSYILSISDGSEYTRAVIKYHHDDQDVYAIVSKDSSAMVNVPSDATDIVFYVDVLDGQTDAISFGVSLDRIDVYKIDLEANELRKIGNSVDELVVDVDGSVNINSKTAKVTYDGSSDEDWQLISSGYFEVPVDINRASYTGDDDTTICDTIPVVANGDDAGASPSCWFDLAGDYFRVYNTDCDDVGELRSWLGDNPATVVYEVSEMTDIPLQSAPLPVLESNVIDMEINDGDIRPSEITIRYVIDDMISE